MASSEIQREEVLCLVSGNGSSDFQESEAVMHIDNNHIVRRGLGPANTTTPQDSKQSRSLTIRAILYLPLLLILFATSFLSPFTSMFAFQPTIPETDYTARTKNVLSNNPLIDGHNNLPYLIRVELKNQIYPERFTFDQGLLSHTDVRKMRDGMMGGQFWSVYIPCSEEEGIQVDDPTWAVRDALEQIDISRRLIDAYPSTLQFCDNPACARKAFSSGKIVSMLGIEGGHLVGNSLATIRQMHALGARYLTTTHNCINAFAVPWDAIPDTGLTRFGYSYVAEMNRLGMMIDLSHVSPQTMRDVLGISSAPVIFSHSSAYALNRHGRNVPDDVLREVKRTGGIVMVNFLTRFLNKEDPDSVTIHDVVDHIYHIVEVAGWEFVGLGSDFDGSPEMPKGLEDVSKYPSLIALVMARGATDEQIKLLVGENILRVWESIEEVGEKLRTAGMKPIEDNWEGRAWWRSDKRLHLMFADSKGRRTPGKTWP